MCFPTLTSVGSVFLLFAFVLEVFILIANLSIKPLLTEIPMVEAWNNNQNIKYTFGLWNYCTGPARGDVQSCSNHVAAYNWAKAPIVNGLAGNAANSWLIDGLFLGMFILFFIAVGFSFVLWCLSLPVCCFRRRGLGISMSTFVFINFLVTLAALILLLVLVLSGISVLTNADNTWNAHAGNSVWIAIGATVSLLLATFCYSGGSCFAPSKRAAVADTTVEEGAGCCGRRRKSRKVEPTYKQDYKASDFIPGTSQPLYATAPAFEASQQQQPQAEMLQQPYKMSPTVGQQGTSHQPYDPNINTGANVSGHGYQTPVLQPANTTQ